MLELKHIYKSFKTKKVLVDINLAFEDSGFVAIIGESGSGKSTLINIMSGIEAPDSGDLIFNGERISFENESNRIKSILKHVAYMPQKQILLSDKTVYENLKEILNIYHIEDETLINIVLKQVHLNEKYKNRIVSTLSTGEVQRVCIAVNLLKQTNILVLDEATENLDPANREFILNILKEISKEKLVVLVTHDTFLAEKYVDRMITISNREIYSDEKLFNESTHTLEESSEEEPIIAKKRKRISLSFTNSIIYALIPLIMVFLIAFISIKIVPNVYEFFNYPSDYFRINQEEKHDFTENEFEMIYEEENTYFVFDLDLIGNNLIGFIDYDFNYKTSKKIMRYDEIIVSNTFLEFNRNISDEFKIIETIQNEKPIAIINYDLVLEHYLENESMCVEKLYEYYQKGVFLSDYILSRCPEKTLALNLPIMNCYEYMEDLMREDYAIQLNFGITVCTIMLSLCIALYIVFVNKQASYYYNMVAFYRVCGQTNIEIRKRLIGKLYLVPIGFIVALSGIVHLLVFFVFKTIEYDKCAFRFDATTYLISLGISLCLLLLLNEVKNFIALKSKLKKLIKSR